MCVCVCVCVCVYVGMYVCHKKCQMYLFKISIVSPRPQIMIIYMMLYFYDILNKINIY